MQHHDSSRLMDLSFRNLPDVSDSSMTFQIPYDAGSATRLMDEDSQDFLRGFDDILNSPMTQRKPQKPLTIEDLTPARKMAFDLQDAMESTFAEDAPRQSSPAKAKKARRSPRKRQTKELFDSRVPENPTEEVVRPESADVFAATCGQATSSLPVILPLRRSPRKLSSRNLLSIIPTQIHPEKTRPKSNISKPSEPAHALSAHALPSIAAVETIRGDTQQIGRIVQQEHVEALADGGIFDSPGAASHKAGRSDLREQRSPSRAYAAPSRDPVAPLTISQLSPPKPKSDGAPTHTQATHAMPPPPRSPMRPSRKRSASPVIDPDAPRAGVQGQAGSHARAKRVKTTAPSIAQKPQASSSSSLRLPPKRPAPTAVHGRRAAPIDRGPSSSKKPGTRSHARRRTDASKQPAAPLPRPARPDKPAPPTLSSQPGPAKPVSRPPGGLPPAKPTKPIEFHFQLDTRLQARRHDADNAVHRRPEAHPVPDFQALHAAQRELDAARRRAAPTVPVPIEFQTDARLRERERFEAGRRARERELEAEREEEARRLAEEEEQAIKEMRKMAVPRANAVPEWYAHAPKRHS
ncbi:hypothetical protein FA95DRAFT_1603409 [Auriscalpium vulgare]|uniref:Uncharacterized protein n=1 Tax=Auriscalpium vulgare TaxID=40419 RepID=A0ACB8S3E0_9AGAM|nr:hypothetical protein FA95DRAFT_1603409 [Auriscalpium vulgare]